jgi:hypothetical protein
MALVVYDRVQETTTTSGTGSVTLLGAVAGFQTFAVVGNTNTTYYAIVDGVQWEVGLGTYSSTGPTLARTTILSNSNADTSPITLSASPNIKQVFVTYPSEKSVNLDSSGNVTALGIVSSGTWNGSTVGVAYGGTGVTASSGANSVMLRDANQNTRVNNISRNTTSTISAGGTTTLTVSSSYTQVLTGTSTQTFKLPDATTLTSGGSFQFNNNSTGALYVVDNGSNAIATVAAGGASQIYLLANGTTNGTWDVQSYIPESVEWGTNSLALGSTVITGGTWHGGTIGAGYGGTGLTTFAAANNAIYSTSASSLTAGTLPVAAGGTGATTLTGYVKGSGTSAFTASSTIPGSDVSGNISGNAANVTGTVNVDHGGTGLTSVSQYYVPFGNNSTTLTTSASFQFNGSTLRVGSQSLLGGATNPIIGQTGTSNGYIQTYIYNANTGSSASADFAAYPDNGSDASGWVDMGITSSTYSDATYPITGANEAYLLGSAPSGAGKSGNLVIATDSTGSTNSIQFYVGGFGQAKGAWKAQITSSGLQLANALGATYGGTGLSSYTTGDIIYASATNTLSKLTAGSNGSVLTLAGGVPTWVAGGVTTFSAGTTGFTPSTATSGAVTLAGTLNVANGGTGVTASSGASSVVLRDANSNVTYNNYIAGYTTIATAGATTTLTVASAHFQRLTGTLTQTVKLPVATTMALGQGFIIDNDSSANVALQDSTASALTTIVPGMAVYVFLETNTTAAGDWSGYMFVPGTGASSNISWGTAGLNMGGSTISSATWTGSAIGTAYGGTGSTSTTYCSLTANVSGILPVANGGTNASTAGITAFNNITGYSASGATGTTTTNLVFSTAPTFTTSIDGGATFNAFQSSTTLTLGYTGSSVGSTTNINSGVAVSGTKTVNLGTNGSTGSVTAINIGSATTSTTTVRGALLVGAATSSTTDGAIFATNNITAFAASDIKFKENVRDIPNALDKVEMIGGKLFDWSDKYIESMGGKDDYFMRKEDAGVIAQDVEKAMPELVRSRDDGSLAVDYPKLVALAFAAIKELKAEVDELKKDK